MSSLGVTQLPSYEQTNNNLVLMNIPLLCKNTGELGIKPSIFSNSKYVVHGAHEDVQWHDIDLVTKVASEVGPPRLPLCISR